jgi:hypothetical protein
LKSGYFVYVDFLPPGKHELVVQFKESSMAYLSFVVEPRVKELPLLRKRVKKEIQLLTFVLKESVFKDWIIPNEKLIEKALTIDWNYSKLKKFIKNEQDQIDTFQVLLKHWRKI